MNKCLVCNANRYKISYKGNYNEKNINENYFMFFRKKNVRPDIAECLNCGFAWSYFDYKTLSLKQIYSNYPVDNKQIDLKFNESIKTNSWIFDKHIKDIKFKNKNLLDIGCFAGFFLHFMKSRGWEVEGIEASKAATDYAKNKFNLNIYNCFFDECFKINNLNYKNYNLITAFDFVEHIQNIDYFFNTVYKLLSDAGLLIITLPNYLSYNRKLLGKYFNLFLLEHLWYFSHKNIKKFVEKCNY